MAAQMLPDLGGVTKRIAAPKPRMSIIQRPGNHEIAPSYEVFLMGLKGLNYS